MQDPLHLESNLLLPDEPEADVQWLEYCRHALQVDKHHVLECVLSDLDTGETSPLWPHIASACQVPHEPGRARESITVLAQLGQALLDCIARAVDDQVNLRMAVEDYAMASTGRRRRPEAPTFAPTTLHEITRRYYATAVVLSKAMGLPLTETFMKEHRQSISTCFIEAGMAGVRLPPAVQLPPLTGPTDQSHTSASRGISHSGPKTSVKL